MRVFNKTWQDHLLFLVWLILGFMLWLFLEINWGQFRYLSYLSMPIALCLSFLTYGQASLVFKCRSFFKTRNTKISGFLRNLGLVGFFVLSSLILTSSLISLMAWGIFQMPAVRMDVLLKRDIYLGLDSNAVPIFWWILGVSFLFGCVLSAKINANSIKPNLYVMAVGTGFSLLSFFAYFGQAMSSWIFV